MIQSLVICLISKINTVTDPYPLWLIIYHLNRQVKTEMVKIDSESIMWSNVQDDQDSFGNLNEIIIRLIT